jgi:predicted alpha/beta superfamily hydrolase
MNFSRMNKRGVYALALVCLFVFLNGAASYGQLTLQIRSVPRGTPVGDTLYLAGSFNNWSPGLSRYKLLLVGGRYQITLPATVSGTIEFKFTRGDWPRVESDARGVDIANRRFAILPNRADTVRFTIEGWKDIIPWPGPNSTASSSVTQISTRFDIPQLNRTRRVWLYLPQDYANSQKRYPVLYMHDGQNLFDRATSYSGEWGVDEALDSMYRQGDYGCIVVGVDNGGANRLNEYSPYRNAQYGGGEGNAYVDFLKQTLKPYIDSAYRTLTEARYTGIAGSSMGGLISLYAAIREPGTFGRVGVLSPAFWFNPAIYRDAARAGFNLPDTRIYMLMGGRESPNYYYPQDLRRMADSLARAGVRTMRNGTLDTLVAEDGQHAEWFWKREFPACYRSLFPESLTSINQELGVKSEGRSPLFNIYPNPGRGMDSGQPTLTIEAIAPVVDGLVSVYTLEGKLVESVKLSAGKATLSTALLAKGTYTITLKPVLIKSGKKQIKESSLRWVNQ